MVGGEIMTNPPDRRGRVTDSGRGRVVHMTSAHPVDDVRIFQKQCVSLANHGYDVTLIAPDRGDAALVDRSRVRRITVPAKGGRLSRMTRTVLAVYRRALQEDAELYHFHDPELVIAGLLLQLRGKNVIFDAHENVVEQILGKHYLHPLLRKPIAFFAGAFERVTVNRLAAVIAATPHIADKFMEINKRTIIVNNYPRLSIIRNRDEGGGCRRTRSICYVGGISEIRGIENLVRALPLVEGCELHLAGNFSPQTLREKLEKLKGWSQVRYHGFLSAEAVAELYQRCDIGMATLLPLPNYVNSQPNKIFEYMAAGLPVVASNFPLWKKIVEGNGCGLCVDPREPQEIARAVEKLFRDRVLAANMGNNGVKLAASTFNWEREEAKLLRLYSSLLLQTAAPNPDFS